jgi:signal transduction histidine kinase
VRASVQDGGAGFDASTLAAGVPDGFGLLNVRERLEYLGGRMKIRSIPGKGTLVALRVPVAPDTSKVREASP